jgi:hypothetical protein
MQYIPEIILTHPTNIDDYDWVSGKCKVYKPANSSDASIISHPTIKHYINHTEIANFKIADNFTNMDPNLLEITSELNISGCPTYENEYMGWVTFNAWIKKMKI